MVRMIFNSSDAGFALFMGLSRDAQTLSQETKGRLPRAVLRRQNAVYRSFFDRFKAVNPMAPNLVNLEGDLAISDLLREAAERSLQVDVLPKVDDTVETPMVSGRIFMQEVQPGLTCTLNDITCNKDQAFEALGDPLITCSVTLDGAIENARIDGYGVVENPRHRATLIGFGQPTRWRRPMKAGAYCKTFGVILRPEFFDRFADNIDDESLGVLEPFRGVPRATVLPPSQRLVDLGNNAFAHPYTGSLDALYHESTALLFLLEVVKLLREESRLVREIGRKNYDQLMSARALLDESLLDPPKTLDLARQIGTNVNKLQAHFKLAFGVTIFGYIRLQRLKIARVLITEHDLGSAEAGYRVGFSSPAAFSAAYRRHFGRSPSEDLP